MLGALILNLHHIPFLSNKFSHPLALVVHCRSQRNQAQLFGLYRGLYYHFLKGIIIIIHNIIIHENGNPY